MWIAWAGVGVARAVIFTFLGSVLYKLNGWEMPGGVPGVVQTTDTVIIIVYTGCSHYLLGLLPPSVSCNSNMYWREERDK